MSSTAATIVQLLSTPSAVQLMDEFVLVSQRSGPQDLEQSTEYRWNDFVPAFDQMAGTGIAGNTFQAPSVKAGLVNIALFLAQCMHETIQYNACDENNWSLSLGVPDYPLTAACGQAGQDYSQYKCSAAEKHMECPIDNNMVLQATTQASWGGAPPPMFCAPTSLTGNALPRWTYTGECGPAGYNEIPAFPNDYISQAVLGNGRCNAYEGQFSGSFTFSGCDSSQGCPNTDKVDTAGGTIHYDVEGCCWWGRGVIQTTGPCNMGKLNYYLSGRQYKDGVPQQFDPNAPYADINFCTNPGVICEGPKELRWIAGMFYWLFDVQSYQNSNYDWEFTSLLNSNAESIFSDPTGSAAKALVDATSGLVNRGCPASTCPGSGNVHALSERFHNFEIALTALKHIYDPSTYPSPSGSPAPPNEGAWYAKEVMCQYCAQGECAIRWSRNGAVSCAGYVNSQADCERASTVAAAWCDGAASPVAVPTPVAPTPVAPTPVAPTPVAPTPVAVPTPNAPSPVTTTPAPVAPTPVAFPTPVAPTPVAVPVQSPTGAPVKRPSFTPPVGEVGQDCVDCINFTSGPCQQANRVCWAYLDASTRTCPLDTAPCFAEPAASPTATAPTSISPGSNCLDCYVGTSGPCQQANKVCWTFLPNSSTCPQNTELCFPEVPSEGGNPAPSPTAIPTEEQPVGEECSNCYVGTSGPCQQFNMVCLDYEDSATKTCPRDSSRCGGDTTGSPSSCPDCISGTSGPCKQADGLCRGYVDAESKTCPSGAISCLAGEEEPTMTPTGAPVPLPTRSPLPNPTWSPFSAPTDSPASTIKTTVPSVSPIGSPTMQPHLATELDPTSNTVTDTPTSSPLSDPTLEPQSKPTSTPVTPQPQTPQPQPSPISIDLTVSPTESPSVRKTASPVSLNAAKIQCNDCVQGTSGPCQQSNSVCWDYNDADARLCPPNTFECEESPEAFPTSAPQKDPVSSGFREQFSGTFGCAIMFLMFVFMR